jgi:ribosome-associated toxin RatA of RatAB toxin-antitoxin module
MSTVRETIEVAVPAKVAYEGLSHFENYPQFMSGVINMTPLTKTTAHMVLDLAGNRAEFDACITESRPGEFLCWEAMDGPQLCETVRLEEISDSTTRIVAELQLDAQQLMPSERHASEAMNRRLKADLHGFKRFLEEGRPTPADMPQKMPMNRPSPATVARGSAAVNTNTGGIPINERPATNMPAGGNLGPMQHHNLKPMQGRLRDR